jgi:hypothetical protein
LSSLEVFSLLDTNELNILVVGSSSEGILNAGKTYEVLIDYLSILGYVGVMEMYDPHEKSQEIRSGGFVVRTYGWPYDWRAPKKTLCGKEFNIVLDDAWIPTMSSLPCELPAFSKIVKGTVPVGTSKFAYKVVDNTLIFKAGLKNHKDFSGGIAGGVIERIGDNYVVSGSSMSYGHYHKNVIRRLFVGKKLEIIDDNIRLGRLTYDPDYNIVRHYPKARVSVKYYGEEVPVVRGRVRDQLYYRGKEKRMLFGVPELCKAKNYGCGCVLCVRMGAIMNSIISYSNVSAYEAVQSMLTRIVGSSCISVSGQKFNSVLCGWLSAARANGDYYVAREDLIRKYKASEKMADRAYQYLYETGKIDVSSGGIKVRGKEFTVLDMTDATKFWNKDRSKYARLEYDEYVIYDALGRIDRSKRYRQLIYRPSSSNKSKVSIQDNLIRSIALGS